MGNKGRPSVNKRRKEEARRLKKKAKAEKFAARAEEKKEGGGDANDISWIKPGPQPLPEEMADLADPQPGDESEEEESEARS